MPRKRGGEEKRREGIAANRMLAEHQRLELKSAYRGLMLHLRHMRAMLDVGETLGECVGVGDVLGNPENWRS